MDDELLDDLLGAGAQPTTQRGAIARALADFVALARGSWPELAGDAREFVRFLAPRVDASDPVASLATLHAGDLWLAHRCAERDPAALRAFLHEMRPQLASVLRDPAARGVDSADLEQKLLARLFATGVEHRARINDYGGKGPLGRWVYVVAMRIRVNSERRRSDKDEALGRREDALLDEVDDPELGYLKRTYHAAFRSAFADALQSLGPRDRTLLRLQVLHNKSATGIAEIYGVHRATAKRWLADIRGRLLVETRARLSAALSIDAGELESIMRLIGSRLEASVRAHLGDGDPVAI